MAHLLRPGTRLRQMAAGVRSLSSVAWTPAAVTGLTYFTAGPTWCFSDAGGTTPCGVGDTIYTWVSRYGPSYTLVQATALNRLTLRQTAGGKYYAEAGTSSFMLTPGNISPGANYPYTMAAGLTVGSNATDRALVGIVTGGTSGCIMHVSSTNVIKVTEGGGGAVTTATTVAVGNRSLVISGPGTGDPAIRMNGAAVAVTANTLVHGSVPLQGGLNTRLTTSSHGGAHNYYGFGFRFTTGALSAAELVALDAYQTTLF